MKKNFNKYKNQSGLVLAIVLVMVPVIFMLSYTSINKLTVGERATTNVVDRARAFYSAEMAIADAETWMKSGHEPFVDGFTEASFNTIRNSEAYKRKGFRGIGEVIDNESMQIDNTDNVFGYGFYEQNVKPPVPVPKNGILAEDPVVNTVITNDTIPESSYIIQLINVSECGVVGVTHNRALFKVVSRGWGVQDSTMVTLENFFSLKFLCPVSPNAV